MVVQCLDAVKMAEQDNKKHEVHYIFEINIENRSREAEFLAYY